MTNGATKSRDVSYDTFETTTTAVVDDGPDKNNDYNNDDHDDDNATGGINTDNRLVKLGLLALTTPGVKFFKSAQSSFQEYLMNDPRIKMSATTYGFMLTLIAMPIVPLVGGAVLDCNGGGTKSSSSTAGGPSGDANPQDDNDNDKTHGSSNNNNNIVMSLRSITASVRNGRSSAAVHKAAVSASQSYSFVGFLGLAVLGIIVYGIGLATTWVPPHLAIPVGLAGVTIFGIGEGCIMVAARAFVGHIFLGGDGAFAQGCLITANSASIMFSKNLVPWLIETHRGGDKDDAASIRVGVLACLAVQVAGLLAGLMYTRLCVADARKTASRSSASALTTKTTDYDEERQSLISADAADDDQQQQQPSMASIKAQRDRELAKINETNSDTTEECDCTWSGIGMVTNLPFTFWIVAIGRAIFLVTFKVFSRFSNSFLIEKLEVGAVRAGRLSSVNEMFALFAPLTGFLAYRSPGGIVVFAICAGLLGTVSIGALALLPADGITGLPGGLLSPLIGISIAHGVIVPVSSYHVSFRFDRSVGREYATFFAFALLLVFACLLDYSTPRLHLYHKYSRQINQSINQFF